MRGKRVADRAGIPVSLTCDGERMSMHIMVLCRAEANNSSYDERNCTLDELCMSTALVCTEGLLVWVRFHQEKYTYESVDHSRRFARLGFTLHQYRQSNSKRSVAGQQNGDTHVAV